MNTYTIAIVDDDIEQTRIIESMIAESTVDASFATNVFTSIAEFEAYLSRGHAPHIVFMDVVFEGGGSGIEAVRKLLGNRRDIQVIYVSGYVEYCTHVYRTEHVYFLTKPLEQASFNDALSKAVEGLAQRLHRPFGVKVGGRIVRVTPSEVEFVESDRRKVHIHLADEVIETYESLGGIKDKLPSSFVQCHKSFLVNMERVAEMRSDTLVLDSGATVPVSQKRSRVTRDAFLSFLQERL